MRRKAWPGADDGVEGLPMTLAVTMVVLAITVPLIIGGFRSYDRARVESELLSEIEGFASSVQALYSSGPGNSAILEFDAPDGALASVESVAFGDVLGGNRSSTARYIISGRSEVMFAIASPNVPMYSPRDDGGLILASGRYRIIAECLVASEDLNGDSLAPDAYVALSLGG